MLKILDKEIDTVQGQEYYDWGHEAWNTLLWLAVAFTATTMGMLLSLAVVVRFTGFGKRFWLVTGGYFKHKSSWLAWSMVFGGVVLEMLSARVTVLTTYCTNDLFTSLQRGDAAGFRLAVWIGMSLMILQIIAVVTTNLVEKALAIRWRQWLNDRVFGQWSAYGSPYRSRFVRGSVDNPDQRIEFDVADFTEKTTNLFFSSVNNLVLIVGSGIALWSLADTMTFWGLAVPKALFQGSIALAVAITLFGFWVGKPLIRLNYTKQRLTGQFRFSLVRLRTAAEQVALHRGLRADAPVVRQRFSSIIQNAWQILFASVRLNAFTTAAAVVPGFLIYIVQAPGVFDKSVSMGQMMQSVSTFGLVQSGFSFFIGFFGDFAEYISTVARLAGLIEMSETSRELPSLALAEQREGVRIDHVTVRSPEGEVLVEDLSLVLRPGESLLVDWPSGSGKSTLFLALAGLWPYAQGKAHLPPERDVMFLPQTPYFPLGSLRAAVSYPDLAREHTDDELRRALRDVQLGHLVERLDDEQMWEEVLSSGEQQRIVFARILLRKPKAVFMDEATSSIDEGLEHAMYSLLKERLREAVVMSTGHRSSLRGIHSRVLRLMSGGAWELSEEISRV